MKYWIKKVKEDGCSLLFKKGFKYLYKVWMGSTIRFILFFQINPFRSTAIKTKEYIRIDHKAIIKRFEMNEVDVNSYMIDIAPEVAISGLAASFRDNLRLG